MGACPSLRSAHPHPCLAALVGDSSLNPTEGVGTSLGVGNPPRQTQAAHTQLRSVPVRSGSLRPSVHAVRGPSTRVGTLSTRAHSREPRAAACSRTSSSNCSIPLRWFRRPRGATFSFFISERSSGLLTTTHTNRNSLANKQDGLVVSRPRDSGAQRNQDSRRAGGTST